MTKPPSDPVVADDAAASPPKAAVKPRDDRRKAALKANMARRKAQVRGRAQAAPGDEPADGLTALQTDTDTGNE